MAPDNLYRMTVQLIQVCPISSELHMVTHVERFCKAAYIASRFLPSYGKQSGHPYRPSGVPPLLLKSLLLDFVCVTSCSQKHLRSVSTIGMYARAGRRSFFGQFVGSSLPR